jgi:hypothetical protein
MRHAHGCAVVTDLETHLEKVCLARLHGEAHHSVRVDISIDFRPEGHWRNIMSVFSKKIKELELKAEDLLARIVRRDAESEERKRRLIMLVMRLRRQSRIPGAEGSLSASLEAVAQDILKIIRMTQVTFPSIPAIIDMPVNLHKKIPIKTETEISEFKELQAILDKYSDIEGIPPGSLRKAIYWLKVLIEEDD